MNFNKKVLDHTCSVLRMFDIEPKPLDRLVDEYLRRHRDINAATRRAVVDLIFNVIRWRVSAEAELKKEGVKKPTREQLVEYVVNRSSFEVADQPPRSSPSAVAAYYSLPAWLVNRLLKQYGNDDACRLMAALKEEAPVTLRTNTLKISRDDLVARLKREGHEGRTTSCSPFGITMLKRAALTATESFQQGLFEIQDEASQLAAMAVDAKPGEVILDACAGAGGKALMLATMMKDQGAVIAADIDPHKLKELERRSARAGFAAITALPTNQLGRMKKYHGRCDAVLLDVPCSGTGTLRRSPDLTARLAADDVAKYADQQRSILEEYAGWLKPGGRLVYVTCSILREENEAVIDSFVNDAGFELLGAAYLRDAGIPASCVVSQCYFVALPTISRMDGFFAAALTRPKGVGGLSSS